MLDGHFAHLFIMKNLQIILIILFFAKISAQNAYKVEYGLSFGISEKEKKIEKYLQMANKIAPNLSFILEVSNQESMFYLQPNILNSESDGKLAIGLSGYENSIYRNFTNKYYVHNNSESSQFILQEFLVTEVVFNQWSIQNEIKEIQGLKCVKAIGTRIADEGDRKFTYEIVAWFCPEIASSAGPMGYGDLPGLILELHENNVVFGAKKISLKSVNKNIIPLKKGNEISKHEYMVVKVERMKKGF